MARKFVINDGRLLMSACVEFHKELVKEGTTTKGGGIFHIDEDAKKIWLFDQSMDFGRATKEDIEEALMNGNYNWSYEEYTFYYCPHYSLTKAMAEGIELKKT